MVKMWLRPAGLSGPRRSEWKTSVPLTPAGKGAAAEGTPDVCPSSATEPSSSAAASKRPVVFSGIRSISSLDARLGRRGLPDREVGESARDPEAEHDPHHLGRPGQAKQ